MQGRTKFQRVISAAQRQLPALLALSFFANLLLLVSSVYMIQVFDRVLSSGSVHTLIWLSAMAVAATVVYGLIEQSRRKMLTRIGSWVELELSPEVLKRAMRARLATGSELASIGDVSDVRGFLGGDAILAWLDAPWTPIFIGLIWIIHPMLGAVAVIGAVVLFAIAVLNDVLTRRQQIANTGKVRQEHAAVRSFFDNAETISALGMEAAVVNRWAERQKSARSDGLALADTNTRLYNLSRVIRLGLQIMIIGVGASLVVAAEMTSGSMIASSLILGRALAPVERSIVSWRSWTAYKAARARLTELFSHRFEVDATILPRPRGALTVEGVGYVTPESRTPVLKRVSFALKPGEVCGIIGPSGSGKSTLCKLITGAYQASVGTIRLDSVDVSQWDSELRGPFVGYLPQHVDLLPGTVAENIARMKGGKDEEIIAAARAAQAHDMILALPDGYDTMLGDGRILLSGGQKQRIGLARALYQMPALVVLDEPASNLDGDGEIALMGVLKALKDRKITTIIVAHQPNMLRWADKVLIVKDGSSAAFGPRDEILKRLIHPAASEKEVREPVRFQSRRGGAKSDG
ncbi:type I secretion system permease/ATPase [Albidovulum sediminicola]|uniref:Type I secretion system permease/ATPase n=1 Tax=Albidovulum sediminicola TaxID=2984331 RepID=A0ABT2Z6A2_9RHOB|nr:type I secretion system permease/ATPase [Defluviimonas sp. WL0075]MCV2866668.1 type I secretion system permease/ATPase [Defluviimonas sp. WL0075]